MKAIKQIIPLVLTVVTFLSVSIIASGQGKVVKTTAKAIDSTIALFPLDDLRPSMKGVARTVFAGSASQQFAIEILGLLPGFAGARQSTIIAKLSGLGVDRTGVFAGMSGSPVFIDDRLVGAIAYSFPFSKEPICGITPIKQMIEIFEQGNDKPKGATEPRAVSFSQLASAEWKPILPRQSFQSSPLIASVAAGSPLAQLMGQQIQEIATPVVFSGISQQSLSLFSRELSKSGLVPVSRLGPPSPIPPPPTLARKTFTPPPSL